jgi:arylsulfatase A-like enzyme
MKSGLRTSPAPGQLGLRAPFLFRNTTQIFPWRDQPGYNMITGMADDAIQYLKQLNAAAPDKPFFLYYVPGGSHAPHQPTPEWIDKFKGKFDMGWNELREQIFANQKRLGVIPQNTTLTPWPDGQPEYGGAKLAKWDTLSADEKKLFARQAEVFAAYVAYTDHEIGRVIQAVDDMGKLDNTLVIYISGDNGTSAEGSTVGTPFDLAALEGIDVPVADQLKFYDVWGSPVTTPHMAVAWSWAFDTPFKWTKQIASHFGGTRQGMVIAWPNRIKDAGGIRTQFHHLIDIVPTILDVTGIPAPKMVNGIAQKPVEGVSMAYTFDKANANDPSTHTTQYFEMLGNRAIYHDGWMASTTPPAPRGWRPMPRCPTWSTATNGNCITSPRTTRKPTISQPRCPTSCGRCRSFSSWKRRNIRCSLWTTVFLRVLAPKPSYTAGRTEFTYAGELTGTPNGDAPNILAKSYTIVADVEVPSDGGEGMIVTDGGRFGGYGLYALKGKPVFTYNLLAVEKVRWEGQEPLTPGKHTLEFAFNYDGPGLAKGGTGVLRVDGKDVSNKSIEHTTPVLLTIDETFDIGSDTRTPVDDADYQVPFPFTGTFGFLGGGAAGIIRAVDNTASVGLKEGGTVQTALTLLEGAPHEKLAVGKMD